MGRQSGSKPSQNAQWAIAFNIRVPMEGHKYVKTAKKINKTNG
jgi:hypothetical protein